MALFNKKYSSRTDSSSSDMNAFLGAGTEFQGRIDFKGTVRIDGKFQGEIFSDGTLAMGKDALFEGVIRVGTIYCDGKIIGDVQVQNKAVLQANSVFEGSLKSPALVVEEGAYIEGDVEMSRPKTIEVERVTESLESGSTDTSEMEDAKETETVSL